MMFWLILVVFVACVIFMLRRRHIKKYRYNGNKLSEPAKDIIKAYAQLPVESQREPISELRRSLFNMDTSMNGYAVVNSHYRITVWEDNVYTFGQGRCACRPYSGMRNECEFKEYEDLFHQIKGIQIALEEQREAISRQRGNKEDVRNLTARLREERLLITDITKEKLL